MQNFLGTRFAAAGVRPETVIAPPFSEPFTVPDHYVRFCDALATELVRRVPVLAETTPVRLAAIRERAKDETAYLQHEAVGLAAVVDDVLGPDLAGVADAEVGVGGDGVSGAVSALARV